jgi:hypothetical protein
MVRDLVRRFEACTLPRAEWSHRTLLRIALFYLLLHGWSGAFLRLRSALRRYFQRSGATPTERGAYHETITLFSLWTLAAWRRRNATAAENWHLLFGRLDDDPVAEPERILRYYSEWRLFGVTARHRFVPPDREALPERVRVVLARMSAAPAARGLPRRGGRRAAPAGARSRPLR